MGFGTWFREKEASGQPAPRVGADPLFWFWMGLLVFAVMLMALLVRLAFGPESYPGERAGLLTNLALILVCLSGIALRTRHHWTAHILNLGVFVAVALYFWLRYHS